MRGEIGKLISKERAFWEVKLLNFGVYCGE